MAGRPEYDDEVNESRTPVAISIAGSDSGGGAGIQADLKAFAAAGVHGTTAITALTAQNTVGVTMIEAVSPEMIAVQVETVAADIGIDAVKVGMLGDEATIDAVAGAIETLGDVPVVVDPVMVSESGSVLLEEGARAALATRIIPLAHVVTPNLAEARVLADAGEDTSQLDLARAVLALGPGAVIVTGGHADGADLLLVPGAEGGIRIEGPLYPDGAAHGSGCTHSATLAALLARGMSLEEAAWGARGAAGRAVRDGLRDVGAGAGPVDVLGVAKRHA
jgi:hydroxymethylpyrimidine/phosphomethylpyrimidine kinase